MKGQAQVYDFDARIVPVETEHWVDLGCTPHCS
jgi:hypothetical protein